jgi:octaprenyl-diphosphate synthase
MNAGKGRTWVSSDEIDEIRAPIREELMLLERELDRIFSPDVDLVSAIGRHLVTTKGKMVRPILVFLSAKLGNRDIGNAIRVAAAVEVIHTATLLHDDSIDRSHLRRGLPTVNRLWNDQVSVIMGDHLFCSAFRLVHEAGLFDVAAVLSWGSDRMTYGEMYQMDLRGKYDVTEEAYLRMIKLKTAALFAAACKAGAMVGGLSKQNRDALAAYGDCLGIAFQMVDDILDFVGDVNLLGKPVGNDLRDGRVTLPLIVALRNAGADEAGRIREIISSGSLDDTAWGEVLKFVDENDGIGYTRRSAGNLVADAKTCIEHLESSPAKASLMRLADLVVTRFK